MPAIPATFHDALILTIFCDAPRNGTRQIVSAKADGAVLAGRIAKMAMSLLQKIPTDPLEPEEGAVLVIGKK